MGLCSSTKNNNKKVSERKRSSSKTFGEICKFYSLKQIPNFNNKISFKNLCPELTEKSIFSFYLYDIGCKGLKSNSNIYMLRIFFGEKILTDFGEGERINFALKETIEVTKNFEELSDSYLMFEISTLKEKVENKYNKKTPYELVASNTGKLTSYASIKFDLLTLSIGSQLYDIPLFGKYNIQNGRISFKIKSIHKNKIRTTSNNIQLILYKEFNENISDKIKIKFTDSTIEKINPSGLSVIDFIKDSEDNDQLIYKPIKKDEPTRFYMSILDFLFANPLYYTYKFIDNEWKIFGFYPTMTNLVFKEEIEKMHEQMENLFNLLVNNKVKNELKEVNYILNGEIKKENHLPLVWNGKKIGEFSFVFHLENLPLIRQFPYGIFTNHGLSINEISISNYLPCSKKSFASFNNIKEQLLNIIENINTKMTKEYCRLGVEINEIRQLFEESVSDDYLCYHYDNYEDIFLAQQIFLKLGNKMFEIFDKIERDEQMTVLEIIRLIPNREEFEQNILFEKWLIYNENTKEYTFSTKIIENKLPEMYLQFYINAFNFAKKYKDIPMGIQYMNELCVNCFFKFPFIRNNIIQSIIKGIPPIKKDEEEIRFSPENQVLFWDLFINDKIKQAIKKLRTEKENVLEISKKFKEELKSQLPFPELEKRNVECFEFLKILINTVQKKLTKNFSHIIYIHWYSITGFEEIINAIDYELGNKNIIKYPENVSEIICCFLNSSKIYKKLINTIITHTNVFDSFSVYYTLDLLDSVLVNFQKKFPRYEIDLDYKTLYVACKVICSNDNSLGISKLIWLYYKNSHLMRNYHLIEITFGIFKPNFFKFFFHWSWKIRKVFYHFLLFIIFYRLNEKIKNEIVLSENDNNKKFSDVFNEEMEILNKFLNVYKSRKIFDVNDENNQILLKTYVNEESYVYVNESIENYIQIKKEFDSWKDIKEKNDNYEYPCLILSPINLDIDRLGAM